MMYTIRVSHINLFYISVYIICMSICNAIILVFFNMIAFTSKLFIN